MALLTNQQAAVTGKAVTFAAAAGGGDTVNIDGTIVLIVRNGDASSKTVTVVRPGTEFGAAVADVPVTVPAGETWVIGPLPQSFEDTDGLADITYSAVTSVTIAAVRV